MLLLLIVVLLLVLCFPELHGKTPDGDRQLPRVGVEVVLPADFCPWACDEKNVICRLMPQPSWSELLQESKGSRDVQQQSTETLLRTLKFVR